MIKNSIWLFLAQILVKSVAFFYNIFLARSLGVEGFGLFSVALAYFAIFNIFSEFGFNRYLIREVGIKPEGIKKVLGEVIIARLVWTLLIFGIFSAVLLGFFHNNASFSIILLIFISALPLSLAQVFDSGFIALKKSKYSAFGLIFLTFSTALLGFLLTRNTANPQSPVIAMGLSNFLYLGVVFLFSILLKINFSLPKINSLIWAVWFKSWPYGFLSVVGLLSFKIDTLLLFYLKGDYQTGIYSAGYKFFEATTFIPNVLATVLSPVLAKTLSQNNVKLLKDTYFKTLGISLLLGVLVMLAFIFILPTLIIILLPKYTSSIQVVQILAFAIPFTFIHIPTAQILLSAEKYLKKMMMLFIVLLVINLITFGIVINLYGYIGAAIATIFSEILTFVIFYIFLQRKIFSNEK